MSGRIRWGDDGLGPMKAGDRLQFPASVVTVLDMDSMVLKVQRNSDGLVYVVGRKWAERVTARRGLGEGS